MVVTLNPSERVGVLAASHPAAARVLEAAGIDYCCAGGRTVADACAQKGLDPAPLLKSIERATAESSSLERNWAQASMTELVDHIEATHHAFVKSETPRLAGVIAKVVKAHGAHRPQWIEVERVFAQLRHEMLDHMQKEEKILFPALRTIESSGAPHGHCAEWLAQGPIRCLMAEHDSAGAALARMRELTDSYRPASNACTTERVALASLEAFEVDMHTHVHKENNILFPAARRAAGGNACSPPAPV